MKLHVISSCAECPFAAWEPDEMSIPYGCSEHDRDFDFDETDEFYASRNWRPDWCPLRTEGVYITGAPSTDTPRELPRDGS